MEKKRSSPDQKDNSDVNLRYDSLDSENTEDETGTIRSNEKSSFWYVLFLLNSLNVFESCFTYGSNFLKMSINFRR